MINKLKKIKPCPFCGSEAKISKTYLDSYWISCPECGAEQGYAYISVEEALEHWNTRKEGK